MKPTNLLLAASAAITASASAAFAADGTSDAAISMAAPLLALEDFLGNTGGALIIIASIIVGVAIWAFTQRAGAAVAAVGVGMFVGYGPAAINSLAGITAELPDNLPVVELYQPQPTDVVTLTTAEYTPLDG